MQSWLNIVKQVAPATGKPFRIIESYATSEGIRSRICSGVYATLEDAEARRVELEAALSGAAA